MPLKRLKSFAARVAAVFILVASTLGGSAQINTDQVMRIGRNALYFEDYVLSIQYFNAVINAKPHLAQPYFFRALAKYYLEDFAGAERDVTLAIERNPFITEAYELRGVLRQNLGHAAEAIADYDAALKNSPYDRGILFNKAMALEGLNELAKADTAYTDLLKAYPGFAEGYLGRAKLRLAQGDTIAAEADIDKALSFDPNSVNGYVIRADIAINSARNYAKALDDMNRAIKLEPKYAGLYINRAFLRHELDDYFGAMSDYDYALQLDPSNAVALFNRAMLRAEVHDFNRAIDDLNLVEDLKGRDLKLLYNRAVIKNEIGDYDGAVADIDQVIDAYPRLAAGYFLRSEINRARGRRNDAKADYDRSIALAKTTVQVVPGADGEIDIIEASEQSGESQEAVSARFTRLLTVSDNSDLDSSYGGNRSIRGRVQNQSSAIELEPMFVVSYYTSPTELKQSSDFIREVTEINDSRMLRFILQVTNREPKISDPEEVRNHFESIDYNTAYISTHQPRPIDYFSRGMDYMTVHNYPEAAADFTRAIAIQPDFALAWLMRGVARYRDAMSPDEALAPTAPGLSSRPLAGGQAQHAPTHHGGAGSTAAKLTAVISDFDKVAELVPDMAANYYNRGVVKAESGDYEGAVADFTQAIALRPEFGEAFFNRGYCNLRLGNRKAGTADLSRAGELGVVPSYNLLKRMGR